MLTHIEEIEIKLAEQPHYSLGEIKYKVGPSVAGFYWIYTRLPIEVLKTAPPPTNQAHVNIPELVIMHNNLLHVIKQSSNDYWCIYNGKGKQLKNRIVAEFNDTKGRTGKIALLRCFREDDFRVKYIECGNANSVTGVGSSYMELEKNLERVWRLHCGWPLLCKA